MSVHVFFSFSKTVRFGQQSMPTLHAAPPPTQFNFTSFLLIKLSEVSTVKTVLDDFLFRTVSLSSYFYRGISSATFFLLDSERSQESIDFTKKNFLPFSIYRKNSKNASIFRKVQPKDDINFAQMFCLWRTFLDFIMIFCVDILLM